MQLASELVIGIGALVLGFALVWFGMPNRLGDSPRFLRAGFMQMVYPAVALVFMTIGIAELISTLLTR
jgi:hypothetical protein